MPYDETKHYVTYCSLVLTHLSYCTVVRVLVSRNRDRKMAAQNDGKMGTNALVGIAVFSVA